MEAKDIVAKTLRDARHRAGLGLRELSRKAKVSRTLIRHLENGTGGALGPVTLVKLTDALGIEGEDYSSLLAATMTTSKRANIFGEVLKRL